MASETFKRWRDPHAHPKPTAVRALVEALAWMAAERIEAARMSRPVIPRDEHDVAPMANKLFTKD